MVEILADLLKILSDILSIRIYRTKQAAIDGNSTKFAQQGFDEKFLTRVKWKYTGNGSEFGVCADSGFFPEKNWREKHTYLRVMAAKFKFRA